MLPTTRLAAAGASPAEIEQLQAEHDASTPEAQDSTTLRFAGIAEADIRDWLDSLRGQGHFSGTAADSSKAEAVDALHKQLAAVKPKVRTRQRPKS